MDGALGSVADLPRVQALARPDAAALWFEGRTTTFAELEAASNRCARALIDAGVRPGERVCVLAKNDDLFFTLWFGCLKARACLTPLNWRLAPPELAAIVRDSEARLLVYGAPFADVALALAGEGGIERRVALEPSGADPVFADWIAGHVPTDPGLAIEPADAVIQLYTSGTTGLPKGVPLDHEAYLALLEGAVSADWARFEPGRSSLVAMPLFHVAGANTGLLALNQGVRAVIVREINPVELLQVIAAERVAFAFLAPVVIGMLLAAPGADTADLSGLERVFYGASPISDDLLRRAVARLPQASFTQLYGLTESVGGGTYLPPEDHDPARGKLRSCGKPWPNYQLRLVTPDGAPAAVGEVGELQLRGPGIMKGYWKRSQASVEALDPDGWFRTGDAGYQDADGYVFIYDRVKDMIVTGGENVYPAEVENALAGHPAVADVAVIGVPDERWGEAVKAVVVLRPDVAADADAIIAHARERIAGYKVPRSIDFADALPRNPSGKVLRRELRAPYWAGRDRQVG